MKGFIYALKNRSYGDHLIKIGRTRRRPDDRARELYNGSSGVPEKFDVALYCEVDDCEVAEKRIHDILSCYRQNKSREFFVMSLRAAKIVVGRVCREVNGRPVDETDGECVVIEPAIFGAPPPESQEDVTDSFSVPLSKLRRHPLPRSELTSDQMERLRIVVDIMGEVSQGSLDKWVSDFRSDIFVERELRIWEFIAKAYLRALHRFALDENQRVEAFALLLVRSQKSAKRALREMEPRLLSARTREIILEGYEDKPRPFIIERIPKA